MRVFKQPTVIIGLVLPEPASFADYEGYLISAISIFSVLLVYNDKQVGVYGTADAIVLYCGFSDQLILHCARPGPLSPGH